MRDTGEYLFTSESVSEGHPDKVADRISDTVLDAFLTADPYSRVACETLVTTNRVVLAGEVRGPSSVTPEYLTVLLGLTVYTAGYIAEVVRAGIQSVPFGQHEAAASLGLSRGQELRLVLLPQALRVIIPPITSQYLNLTKNSSLAVAVGYPDLVSISSTALNQTGRAIECIAMVMACYLTLSLLTSALMNIYNARSRLKDR